MMNLNLTAQVTSMELLGILIKIRITVMEAEAQDRESIIITLPAKRLINPENKDERFQVGDDVEIKVTKIEPKTDRISDKGE